MSRRRRDKGISLHLGADGALRTFTILREPGIYDPTRDPCRASRLTTSIWVERRRVNATSVLIETKNGERWYRLHLMHHDLQTWKVFSYEQFYVLSTY